MIVKTSSEIKAERDNSIGILPVQGKNMVLIMGVSIFQRPLTTVPFRNERGEWITGQKIKDEKTGELRNVRFKEITPTGIDSRLTTPIPVYEIEDSLKDADYKVIPEINNFVVSHKEVLDLNNPIHKIKYNFLLEHPFIARNKESVTEKTLFYLVNLNEVGKGKKESLDILAKATSIFKGLSESEIVDMARLYGVNGRFNSIEYCSAILCDEIMSGNESKIKGFINKFENEDKKYIQLIKKLIEYDIIDKKNKSYYHNGELLGIDELAMISWLKDSKNKSMVIALQDKCKA